MKLLLDENLASRLVAALADLFPESSHVRDVGLEQADDLAIWVYARTRGFTIVWKDADFSQHSLVSGHPPKVIWVRLGKLLDRWHRAVAPRPTPRDRGVRSG